MTDTNDPDPEAPARHESTAADEQERYRPTLADLSHSNPRTGERFGEAMVYRRGPAVAADGGAAGATPEDGEPEPAPDAESEPETKSDAGTSRDLRDVDHTPPRDAEGANRVHERGGEGRTENV